MATSRKKAYRITPKIKARCALCGRVVWTYPAKQAQHIDPYGINQPPVCGLCASEVYRTRSKKED
jgi:hypothetical protein